MNNNPTSGPDSIATVKDLSRLYPAFSVRSIRYLIEKSRTNGFGKCVLRIGRNVYIDLDYFEQWLEERRQK